MTIYGTEKFLGTMYEAKRIENNETVYGLSVIKIDDEKSYLIQMFETNDFTDGAPALAHYVAVWTNSVLHVQEEDNSCKNCGECRCFSCEYREGGHGGDCAGRCYDCGDKPIEECNMFKFATW